MTRALIPRYPGAIDVDVDERAFDERRAEPMPRRAPPPARSWVVVGAPPLIVSMGAPGARDEVRAYVARVDVFVDKLRRAIRAWLNERGVDLTDPMHPTVPADFSVPEADLVLAWTRFDPRWQAWVEQTSKFDLFGPSAAQAWQTTQLFEAEAMGLRDRLEKIAKATKSKVDVPPAPGSLEPPGGHDPGGILPAKFPWDTVVAIGLLLAGGYAITSVARLKGG
jgi:hypothetical protein